jgi:hypothetical protein
MFIGLIMNSTHEFLSKEVWPYLDAVEAGLFDDLKPTSKLSGGNYKMTCPNPKCAKPKRAFYFPGGIIICDRKNECGFRISTFDYLVEFQGFTRKDALEACVRATGKELPKGGTYKKTADSVFKRVTKEYLFKNQEILDAVCSSRHILFNELKTYDLGFFPPLDVLYEAFKKEKIPFREAQDLGFLPMPKSAEKKNNAYFLQNRLIGFWKQPDGNHGIWARTIDGYESPGQDDNAKYLFSSGISKSIPYMLRGSASQWHVAIEGPMDVLALTQLGMNAFGIGGASIISSQAEVILSHNIKRVIHVTDGDFAGLSGGVDSVLNCAIFNIDCYVSPLGPYLDDPDDLRKQGKDLVTARIIQESFRPGEFLAHTRHHIYKTSKHAGHLKYIDKIDNAMGSLPPHIKSDFNKTSIEMGYFFTR